MAFKRSGGNPDNDAEGVLNPSFTESFFSEQERQGFGASELIKTGKTDTPDDQLLRTIFKSDEQAQSFSSLLQKADRFSVKEAKAFCTYYMEALVSVHGVGRDQFLQGLTLNYNDSISAKLMDNNKNNKNNRPIMPGD